MVGFWGLRLEHKTEAKKHHWVYYFSDQLSLKSHCAFSAPERLTVLASDGCLNLKVKGITMVLLCKVCKWKNSSNILFMWRVKSSPIFILQFSSFSPATATCSESNTYHSATLYTNTSCLTLWSEGVLSIFPELLCTQN